MITLDPPVRATLTWHRPVSLPFFPVCHPGTLGQNVRRGRCDQRASLGYSGVAIYPTNTCFSTNGRGIDESCVRENVEWTVSDPTLTIQSEHPGLLGPTRGYDSPISRHLSI